MRVLFSHDGPMKKDEMNNYYESAHNDKMFSRYYEIATELVVAMRVTDVDAIKADKKLSKITVNPIEFVEIPNLNSFAFFKNGGFYNELSHLK